MINDVTGMSITVTSRSSNPILAFGRHMRVKLIKSEGDCIIDVGEKTDLVNLTCGPVLWIQRSYV